MSDSETASKGLPFVDGPFARKTIVSASNVMQRYHHHKAGARSVRFVGAMGSEREWRLRIDNYLPGSTIVIDGQDLVATVDAVSNATAEIIVATTVDSKSFRAASSRPWNWRNGDPHYLKASDAIQMTRLIWDDVHSAVERDTDRELGLDRYEAMMASFGVERSVQVFATGPSLSEVTPEHVNPEAVRISCNSVVADHALMSLLGPDVICFGDPAFHFSHCEYAKRFRADLLRELEHSDPWLVVPLEYCGVLRGTDIWSYDKLVPVAQRRADRTSRFSTEPGVIPNNANVLTTFMLPLAAEFGAEIEFFGCDGRDPDDDGFWKHSPRAQYDDLYQTVVDAHPAFFGDTDYVAYYLEHCENLRRQVTFLRDKGVKVSSALPSYIPVLADS